MMNINIIFLLVFIFIPVSVVSALAFECQDESGKTVFQDSPCEHSSPIKVMSFPSKASHQTSHPASPKALKQQEKTQKTLKKNYKQLNAQEKKASRLKTRIAKQELKTAERSQKRTARVLQIEEKIAHIDNQLRQGCKFKRASHLTEERERLRKMKDRYSEQ